MMTCGHRYTLVLASLAKRALAGEMPNNMRLEFLQHLDRMTDMWVTPEVIAMVDPMDERGYQLSREAAKLGYRGRPSALDIYAQKFEIFAALNPSLQRAYDAAFKRTHQFHDA
ncbi:hypothetical protein [Bradyrhizobium sp. 1200_D9_N1_1]|uniref:hypothetical protein n=1 Tax=Bradyrhizobium sp. 1200_D9_N1_1 TaxID=3239013 RepID=UPI003D450760